MKNTKKLVAVLVALAMVLTCVFALVACTDTPDNHECKHKCETCQKCTDKDCTDDACKDKCPGHGSSGEKTLAETLVEGIWEYTYARVDTLVFHEDGIFYHSKFSGGLQSAGYWRLVEGTEERTWTEYNGDLNDKGITEFKSKDYLVLTNFDGSVYVNDQSDSKGEYPIYNGEIRDVSYAGSQYVHKADGTITEVPQTVAEYIVEGNAAFSVSLGHNGQFTDFVDGVNLIEGTWSYDAATRTYTLKSTGGTATLTISEDGETAVYKAIDGTQKTLVNANIALKPVYRFIAIDVDNNNNVKGVVELYEEESACALFLGGVKVDDGTWSYDSATKTFTIKFEKKGTHTTSLNAQGKPSFTLTENDSATGEDDVFEFVLEVAAQPQVRFTGSFLVNNMFQGNTEVLLYDDGSATFVTSVDMSAAGMGVVEINEEGTWSLNPTTYHMTITIPVEDGEDRVFTAQPVDAQGTYKFTYIFSYGSLQNVEVEMTKVALVEAVTVKKELSTTVTIVPGVVENVPFTLTFTSDGKVTLSSSMGIEITADWVLTAEGLPSITFSNASKGEFSFTLGAEVTFTWVGSVSDQMPGDTTITFTMASSELADLQ